MNNKPFSEQLASWQKDRRLKSIQGLSEIFAEKSFAMAFLILMSIPALPLPTGGITHIFEILTMLLSLEMVAGRRQIWLPRRWLIKPLPPIIQFKTIPFLSRWVGKLERFSRPRLVFLSRNQLALSIAGMLIFALSLVAFLAPPFTGLDTLPSLGVVIISLGIILEDSLLLAVGLLVGIVGTGLVVGIGAALLRLIRRVF